MSRDTNKERCRKRRSSIDPGRKEGERNGGGISFVWREIQDRVLFVLPKKNKLGDLIIEAGCKFALKGNGGWILLLIPVGVVVGCCRRERGGG